jgi:ClpP class serine protease
MEPTITQEQEGREYEIEVIRSTRTFEQATTMPWAITEGALMDIVNIAARSNLDVERALAIQEAKAAERMDHFLAGTGSERLKGTRNVLVTSDGTAVVPVFDSLFRRGGMFSSMSGAMSMEMIESDFRVARASKNVRNFFMDVDSPGGSVSYTEELARTIRQIALENDKFVQTFSSGMMCSAAEWIGSAGNDMAITPNGMAGSCGVISTYISLKEMDKARGIKRIQIVSSNAPKKALDPDTKEGYAGIKQMVDAFGDNFARELAANRGLTQEHVESWQGGVLIGHAAVEAKMVDRIAYRDQVMSELANDTKPKQYAIPGPKAKEPVEEKPKENAETENGEILSLANPVEPDASTTEEVVPTAEETQDNAPQGEFDTIIPESSEVDETNMADQNNNEPGMIAKIKALINGEEPQATETKSAREIRLEATARTAFLAGAKPKVVPAAHDALSALYEAAQDAGIEDKVEAFVSSLPAHKLTQDRLAKDETGDVTTAEEPDDEDYKAIDAAVDAYTG